MNKKEIAQAQELIDSGRRGDPPGMVEAVFPAGEPVRPATPPRYGQYWSEADIKQRIKEIESKHMSDWTDEEMQFYNEITGQPAAPAVPDAAARLDETARYLWKYGISAGMAKENDELMIGHFKSKIAALIREAGEMRPAPDEKAVSLAWDGPQGHKADCLFVVGKANLSGCSCGWTAYCDRNKAYRACYLSGKTDAASPSVPPKLTVPREQLLDEARKRYESASSEDDKQYWREQIAFLATHIDAQSKLGAREFYEFGKVHFPNVFEFSEAYAQHVAAGETREQPLSDDVALETAIEDIGDIALDGVPQDSGFIFDAPKVRAVVSRYASEKAESEALKLREALREAAGETRDEETKVLKAEIEQDGHIFADLNKLVLDLTSKWHTERDRAAKAESEAFKLRECGPGLIQYVEAMAGIHEDDCPLDDTCNCKWKSVNDSVNKLCHLLAGEKVKP